MALDLFLIGWDGGTFSLLDPLMSRGLMPRLSEVVSLGVRADLRSIVPPLTPPAWSSMITGRTPGYHGVFDFFQKERPDSLHLRLTLSSNVRTETLWSIARREGLRSTLLNYPVTFPPPPIDGYVVSGGWLTWRQLRLACRPKDLYERIRALEGMDLKTLAMDMAHEEKAIEGCSSEEKVEFVERHIERERHWFRILSHLMETDPTEIVAIVFDGVDKIQHLCWPFLAAWAQGRQIESPTDRRTLESCLAYFRELDRLLGAILDRRGPHTNVLIVSDHGFGESRDMFYLNQWLHDEGHLRWKEAAVARGQTEASVGMGLIARHAFEMDWEKTRAYAATPSSNGIHLVEHTDGTKHSPVTRGERDRLQRSIVAGLMQVQSPTRNGRLVERIWTREEAFPGPCGDLAPDLTLALWDGGLISILPSKSVVAERREPVGAHRPEGIFLALGPAFEGGRRLAEISLLDVMPAMLHLLGLPAPDGLEGRPPAEAFTSAVRESAPRRRGPTAAPGGTEQAVAEPEEALVLEQEEEQIAERLRQLGYLE